MNADSGTRRTKSVVEMLTRNPVHECDIKWTIQNATKFSRKICTSDFAIESECEPKFKIVAKFHQKYHNVTNINVGLQRIDDGNQVIQVDLDLSLVNNSGAVNSKIVTSYTCSSGGSPYYFFSELFATDSSGLTVRKAFSYNDEPDLLNSSCLAYLATYENERVFMLPEDMLNVKGVVKTYGCCVVSETLPVPQIYEELTQDVLLKKLLDDFRSAYETELLTDVDLRVGSNVIRAHRFVLRSRSPVFRNMFEHDMKENEEGIIDIVDVDILVMEAFVWYLYTGVVKDLSWDMVCGLYAISDRYQVLSLQNTCSDILRNLIDDSSVCEILQVADTLRDAHLKKESLDYIARYFAKIKPTVEWESMVNRNPRLVSEILEIVTTIYY